MSTDAEIIASFLEGAPPGEVSSLRAGPEGAENPGRHG